MSDFSINANIYNVSKKFLELINHFMVKVNYDPHNLPDELLNKVRTFIAELINDENTKPDRYMIRMILDRAYRKKNSNAKVILSSIQSKLENKEKIRADELKELSEIAKVLNRECDSAYERMRIQRR